MKENIRKAFLNMLERLSENIDYQGRITKSENKFSVHTLAAFLSYYTFNPLWVNNKGKEYLLSSTELFSLLKNSSVGLEEIWNLIDIVNRNSYISDASQQKYLIPSISLDMDKFNLSSSFEEYDWKNVSELLQDLEKRYKLGVSNSEDEFVVGLNIILEDINKVLHLFKKSKVDQNHDEKAGNKTKQSELSLLLKRLSNVLMLKCENEENILSQGLKDKNKCFKEKKDSSAESDCDDSSEKNNSSFFEFTINSKEQRSDSEKETHGINVDDDDCSSSKSDKVSEHLEGNSITSDKEEFDSESEALDNNIDYFKDIPGDVSDVKYNDFYKDLEDHKLKNTDIKKIDEEICSEVSDSSERDEVKEPKSAFELKEEKKKKKITKLEEDLLKSKPWTLQGEVDASQRPFNSLLEEVVEVDLSQRPPPVITRKRTKKLHNIICEIILNKSFDDVEKKQRPVIDVNEFKNKIVLDQEKSKLSLAEIYEKKYLKEMESKSTEEKEESESAEKKEIRELMHSVITKLQALSNLYFIPKPAIPELRVVSNLPAVAIEEVGPIAMSHDKLLAPEEISGNSKRLAMDKEERTATDKKRERRKKKLLQKYRAKRAGINENLTSISGKKHKNTEELNQSSTIKQLKTSKTFFDQLQQKQETNIKLQKNSKVSNNFKSNSFTAKKSKKRKPDSNCGRIEPKKIKL